MQTNQIYLLSLTCSLLCPDPVYFGEYVIQKKSVVDSKKLHMLICL